jgi:hypothetical protein
MVGPLCFAGVAVSGRNGLPKVAGPGPVKRNISGMAASLQEDRPLAKSPEMYDTDWL